MITLIKKDDAIWRLDQSNLTKKELQYCISRFKSMPLPEDILSVRVLVGKDLKSIQFELIDIDCSFVGVAERAMDIYDSNEDLNKFYSQIAHKEIMKGVEKIFKNEIIKVVAKLFKIE